MRQVARNAVCSMGIGVLGTLFALRRSRALELGVGSPLVACGPAPALGCGGVCPPEAGGLLAPPSCTVIPARHGHLCRSVLLWGENGRQIHYLGTHPIYTHTRMCPPNWCRPG